MADHRRRPGEAALGGLLVLAAALALAACSGSTDTTTVTDSVSGGQDQELGAERRTGDQADVAFSEGGAKTTCPASVTGADSRDTCTLAFEDVAMRECADRGPGGFDVMADGISCAEARQLRLPLGTRTFSSYRRAGEGVYRPWLATGRFTNPKPTEPIGWTCWHRWDPEASEGGIRHVCWNGAAIVLFKIG